MPLEEHQSAQTQLLYSQSSLVVRVPPTHTYPNSEMFISHGIYVAEAQWLKCSLKWHKDLSSESQYPHKSWAFVTLELGRDGNRRIQGLSGQPV